MAAKIRFKRQYKPNGFGDPPDARTGRVANGAVCSLTGWLPSGQAAPVKGISTARQQGTKRIE